MLHILKIKDKALVLFLTLLLTAVVSSCRDNSDEILSYSKWGTDGFGDADSSMEGQFNAFWTALNSNYPIWDYEESYGVDWDQVYDEHIELFRKADEDFKKSGIILTDSLFFDAYTGIMLQLHDGHTSLIVKNIHTGNKKRIFPAEIRACEKDSWEDDLNFHPNLSFYQYAAGENFRIKESLSTQKYQYALFADGIVYLYLNECQLPKHFDQTSDSYSSSESEGVRNVWRKWFDTIQELHGKNSLKGVIIDVRSNTGGVAENNKYIFGSLRNNEFKGVMAYKRGYTRRKNGIGRLDYQPAIPCIWDVLEEEHATITEPIVVLANILSGSAAEQICLDAKELPNAIVLGTQTWGAYSPLNEADNAVFGVGTVGDIKKMSFEIEIPSCAYLTDEGRIIEGIGVIPDMEILLDPELKNNNRDSQLEKALEYIRNKNY